MDEESQSEVNLYTSNSSSEAPSTGSNVTPVAHDGEYILVVREKRSLAKTSIRSASRYMHNLDRGILHGEEGVRSYLFACIDIVTFRREFALDHQRLIHR